MKKTVSILISLILLISSVPVTDFSAAADEPVSTGVMQNPFYAGREVPSATLEEYTVTNSESRTYGGKTYYTRGKQLYRIIASALEKRTAEFKVYYLSTAPIISRAALERLSDSLFVEATDDSMSESCTDGDYIRWAINSWGCGISLDERSGYYYYTLDFVYSYNDTANQEKQVDSVVNSFVEKLDTDSMSDYEIIKTVHDFVCESTTYDYDAMDDTESHKYAFSAYGALVKGKCVCQGYSLAFYRICRELGYSARIITSVPHAWNLVGLNDKYYYVDATWDDTDDESDYTYFLVNASNLQKYDGYNEHKPEEEYYDGEYYNETYGEKIDSQNYNSKNRFLLSNCKVALSQNSYTYSGEANVPSVTVTDSNGNVLSDGDYTLSCKNNVASGSGRVNLDGGENYSGSTHRLFTILPAKMTALSLASGGRGVSAITLKWTAMQGVSGYKIERYSGGRWTVASTVSGASKTSAKITSLAAASQHKFRIRAYKTVSKRTLFGAYSKVYTTCTKPKKPAITLKTAKKSITVSWKRVECTGYEIQYSQNKKFTSSVKKYTAKSTATSKKVAKLKTGTRYYVRVRAYKTFNGKKLYSPWSSAKSLKCK